jgi:hypothetical protein
MPRLWGRQKDVQTLGRAGFCDGRSKIMSRFIGEFLKSW